MSYGRKYPRGFLRETPDIFLDAIGIQQGEQRNRIRNKSMCNLGCLVVIILVRNLPHMHTTTDFVSCNSFRYSDIFILCQGWALLEIDVSAQLNVA